ncbi:hypothetical protein [Acaryochloris marina]|uniref:hypothetical protein n=1 Tax=Acaryochloris marina TaxID=155978 RepID=UPI0011D1646A|nr:hypothetical protein [Acaryochloris marina]BDM79207.1 hypothetical protein AM10699_20750 [Acaryochloris marina MBIC10699]
MSYNKNFEPKLILECACTIRGHLPNLFSQDTYLIDKKIAQLVENINSGEPQHDQLLDLLVSFQETKEWVAEFLSLNAVSKGYDHLPDSIGLIDSKKFICPYGDFIWYQRNSSQKVPRCPTHGELIPVN